jgi:hypothetical protein
MRFPVFSEAPLWLVLVHWYGLLLIALFELLHAGDAWLVALPWNDWPQVLAAGWRSGQLPAGALLLLYLNGLMLTSALLLVYVFVRVLAANRQPRREAQPANANLPEASPAEPTSAARAEAAGDLWQNPEIAALVSRYRAQLKRITVAGAGAQRR